MKILHDNVLIKEKEAEQVSPGGIIVAHLEKSGGVREGFVVALGHEVRALEAGDRIVFVEYGATPINHDGEDYMLVKAQNVLAVVGD